MQPLVAGSRIAIVYRFSVSDLAGAARRDAGRSGFYACRLAALADWRLSLRRIFTSLDAAARSALSCASSPLFRVRAWDVRGQSGRRAADAPEQNRGRLDLRPDFASALVSTEHIAFRAAAGSNVGHYLCEFAHFAGPHSQRAFRDVSSPPRACLDRFHLVLYLSSSPAALSSSFIGDIVFASARRVGHLLLFARIAGD